MLLTLGWYFDSVTGVKAKERRIPSIVENEKYIFNSFNILFSNIYKVHRYTNGVVCEKYKNVNNTLTGFNTVMKSF